MDSVIEPKGISRRAIISGMIALGIGTIIFGSIVSAVKFLWPPEEKFGGGISGEVGLLEPVALVKELPVGQAVYFSFEENAAAVVHLDDGFYAFGVICTHLACICNYQDPKKIWYSACHAGVFDVKTGEVLAGPPPDPLPKLKFEIRSTDKGDGIFPVDWEDREFVRSLKMYHA